jgi:hypothetical protein
MRRAEAGVSMRRPGARRAPAVGRIDTALDAFCDEWNLGTPERARFEKEYLLAVGTRAED